MLLDEVQGTKFFADAELFGFVDAGFEAEGVERLEPADLGDDGGGADDFPVSVSCMTKR